MILSLAYIVADGMGMGWGEFRGSKAHNKQQEQPWGFSMGVRVDRSIDRLGGFRVAMQWDASIHPSQSSNHHAIACIAESSNLCRVVQRGISDWGLPSNLVQPSVCDHHC